MALLRNELRRLTQPSPEMAEVGAEIVREMAAEMAAEMAEVAPLSAEARWLQQVDMPPAPCPCPLLRTPLPTDNFHVLLTYYWLTSY